MPPKLRNTTKTKRKRVEINSEPNLNERAPVPVPPAAKKRKTKRTSPERLRSYSSSGDSLSGSQPNASGTTESTQATNTEACSCSSFDKYLQVRYKH